MKEGWRMVKLGEVADLQSGYTPSKDDLRTSGNYPYFKVGEMNLIENSVYLQKTSQYINNPRKIYKRGSVVFPRNGGAVYTEKKRILLKDSVIDLNTGAIIPNEKIVYNRYLYMWTCYEKFSKYDNGGGLPSLNFKKMINTEIPLPSLEEQHRIVSLLDASFEKIDTLKKNAEENLKNAKALFQQVLTQELQPKEGWVEKKLGEVCEISRGRSKHRPRNDQRLYGGNIPFIQTGDIRDACGGVITKYKQTYSELGLLQSRLWKKGTICMTIAANIGETAILGFDACFPDSVVGMYPNDSKVNYLYVNYYLNSIKAYIDKQAYGAAQKNINLVVIENLMISFPTDIDQQKTIVSTLDTLSEKCRRLEQIAQQTIRECDALKQSILRQAFSGKL